METCFFFTKIILLYLELESVLAAWRIELSNNLYKMHKLYDVYLA